MKFKPKEVLVNLPVVLTFATEDEVVQMAAAFNTFVHGKVKMKYELLGTLGGQYVALFYIQRNSESQQLHDEFMKLIEDEEIVEHNHAQIPELVEDAHPRHEDLYAHSLCTGCDDNNMLHVKGEDHCRCGANWTKGKCAALNKSSSNDDMYDEYGIYKDWGGQ